MCESCSSRDIGRREFLAVSGVLGTRTKPQEGHGYDIGLVNDTDAADLCFFAVRSRLSMDTNVWDQAQTVNSRERRRLVGAFYITPVDILNRRTYSDVVVQHLSDFDSHGYTSHEALFVADLGRKQIMANLPYRCLLPKQLDGLLVIGLGISAHRDAMPVLRMQADIQNLGYAAGVASALAVKTGVTPRHVDVRALQHQLIEKRILSQEVLTWDDSFPLADTIIAEAVGQIPNGYQGLEVVLTDPARSLPLLRRALAKNASPEADLAYAHVLGMMGDAAGQDRLIAKVRATPWDKGFPFKSHGQYGRSVSWMDSYMIALGRAKSAKAVAALVEKASALGPADDFSHFRAVSLTLEAIGDKSAAPALARLLALDGVGGHAIVMSPLVPALPDNSMESGDRERGWCLRELGLARAFFRLGDFESRGERVLRAYADDPRGVYAAHAKMVLEKRYGKDS
jgi:hypothetical protein